MFRCKTQEMVLEGETFSLVGEWRVRIVQGSMELEAELLEGAGKALRAPTEGAMARTIHENAACRAKYHFQQDGRTLLDFETDRASFEYEYLHPTMPV